LGGTTRKRLGNSVVGLDGVSLAALRYHERINSQVPRFPGEMEYALRWCAISFGYLRRPNLKPPDKRLLRGLKSGLEGFKL
jgi:hypothetical protein